MKLGIMMNVAVATFLLVAGDVSGWMAYVIGTGIAVSALLSMFIFVVFSFGWSMLLSKDPSVSKMHEPGSPSSERILRVTLTMVDGCRGMMYWVSVSSAFYLMYALMIQDWIFVLVLEILATALSYGFIGWADKRRDELTARAKG